MLCLLIATLGACTAGPSRNGTSTAAYSAGGQPAGGGAVAEDDIARVRAATASFRVLDSAVAAGYSANIPRCMAHGQHGGMGFHHANRALMDGRVELERPEILTYARAADGEYKLTGVEYVVPYSSLSRDAEPPVVMGQRLRQSDPLKIWYLHAWIWEENPAGLFADWNPRVVC